MQPKFNRPEFLEGNSAEEIHERMMNNLPEMRSAECRR